MKRLPIITAAFILGVPLQANPTAQPQIILTLGSNDTINADWVGVDGRTYFVQCSLELQNWFHAPVVEHGLGVKSYGMQSTSPRLFLRLSHTDVPPIAGDAEAMDFDGDGIPSLFEVSIFGTDPLITDTDGDLTDDGDEYSNPSLNAATGLEIFTPLQ